MMYVSRLVLCSGFVLYRLSYFLSLQSQVRIVILVIIFDSSLPPVVCRRNHALLCMITNIGVQLFDLSYVLVPYCDIHYDFHIKTPVVCGRFNVLFVICVFAYNGVQCLNYVSNMAVV